MKIGVSAHGFVNWGGGVDFLANFCGSLREMSSSGYSVDVLMPIRGPNYSIRALARWLLRRPGPSGPDRVKLVARFVDELGPSMRIRQIDSGPMALERAVRKHEIGCVLPMTVIPPPGLITRSALYIYDVQHRHLPEYFEASEINARDEDFSRKVALQRPLVVNSRAVASDLRALFGASDDQLVPLPFCPSVFDRSKYKNSTYRERRGIPSRYLMVSNQFWKHKNHARLFEALAVARECFPEIALVCTGAETEPRDRGYISRLNDLIEGLGIRRNVYRLGYIEKHEQMCLMASCVAVVQPTLFEGGPGGGSVFDAVGLGKPIVLSNIPVNMEIDYPNSIYFDPHSVESIANSLVAVWKISAPDLGEAEITSYANNKRGEHVNAVKALVQRTLRNG